jgi:hypothetical protein
LLQEVKSPGEFIRQLFLRSGGQVFKRDALERHQSPAVFAHGLRNFNV